jgi:hypothetical protein
MIAELVDFIVGTSTYACIPHQTSTKNIKYRRVPRLVTLLKSLEVTRHLGTCGSVKFVLRLDIPWNPMAIEIIAENINF